MGTPTPGKKVEDAEAAYYQAVQGGAGDEGAGDEEVGSSSLQNSKTLRDTSLIRAVLENASSRNRSGRTTTTAISDPSGAASSTKKEVNMSLGGERGINPANGNGKAHGTGNLREYQKSSVLASAVGGQDLDLTATPPEKPPLPAAKELAIPEPNMLAMAIRSFLVYPVMLVAVALTQLYLGKLDVMDRAATATAQATATCSQLITEMALMNDPGKAIPSLIKKSLQVSARASIYGLNQTLGLVIQLAQALILFLMNSYTRVWRAILLAVLSGTTGIVNGVVSNAVGAWNSALQDINNLLNTFSNVLNNQLLSSLGNQFNKLFGTSFETSVQLPNVQTITLDQLRISNASLSSITAAINAIPSVEDAWSKFLTLITGPFAALQQEMQDLVTRLASSIQWDNISFPLPPLSIPVPPSLQECANGATLQRALQQFNTTVESAFQFSVWAGVGIAGVIWMGSFVRELHVRRKRRAQLKHWIAHASLHPKDFAWSLQRPANHAAVHWVQWCKDQVSIHQSGNVAGRTPLSAAAVAQISQVVDFVTHVPSIALAAGALTALATIWLQEWVMSGGGRVVVGNLLSEITRVLSALAVDSTETLMVNFKGSLANASTAIDQQVGLLQEQMNTEVVSTVTSSLQQINQSLGLISDSMANIVTNVIKPIPIFGNTLGLFADYLAAPRLNSLQLLISNITSSKFVLLPMPSQGVLNVSDPAVWALLTSTVSQFGNEMKAKGTAGLQQALGTSGDASVGSVLDQVIAKYQITLNRQKTVAYYALAAGCISPAIGITLGLASLVQSILNPSGSSTAWRSIPHLRVFLFQKRALLESIMTSIAVAATFRARGTKRKAVRILIGIASWIGFPVLLVVWVVAIFALLWVRVALWIVDAMAPRGSRTAKPSANAKDSGRTLRKPPNLKPTRVT